MGAEEANPVSESLNKLRLADRTQSILRKDRNAIRHVRQGPREAGLLLAVASDTDAITRLLDQNLPPIAAAAGLEYVRLVAATLQEVPRALIPRTFLVLADLTGRDEDVITLVYQTFGDGRRVLLAGRDPSDIPCDLGDVPSVLCDLAGGQIEPLLDEVRRWSTPAVASLR